MTTNDYDARLARLEAATKGDTVTVPDGWEKPGTTYADTLAVQRADLRPGDVFTHDGTADNLRWSTSMVACARKGNRLWYSSETLAALGLDVDTTDDSTAGDAAPAGPRVTVSDAVPEGTAIAGDFSTDDAPAGPDALPAGISIEEDLTTDGDEHDGDEVPASIGTVTIEVVPDTDRFMERVRAVAAEATETLRGLDKELEGRARPVSVISGSPLSDLAGHLDGYGQERLAALELGMRVLEARRRPSGTGTGFAGMIGLGAGRMVAVQDMIDVAAFIVMGDTGRLEDGEEDRA